MNDIEFKITFITDNEDISNEEIRKMIHVINETCTQLEKFKHTSVSYSLEVNGSKIDLPDLT